MNNKQIITILVVIVIILTAILLFTVLTSYKTVDQDYVHAPRANEKVMFTGTKSYSGLKLADWTNGAIFDVIEVSGDRVVIGKGTAVTAAVNIKDCRPV